MCEEEKHTNKPRSPADDPGVNEKRNDTSTMPGYGSSTTKQRTAVYYIGYILSSSSPQKCRIRPRKDQRTINLINLNLFTLFTRTPQSYHTNIYPVLHQPNKKLQHHLRPVGEIRTPTDRLSPPARRLRLLLSLPCWLGCLRWVSCGVCRATALPCVHPRGVERATSPQSPAAATRGRPAGPLVNSVRTRSSSPSRQVVLRYTTTRQATEARLRPPEAMMFSPAPVFNRRDVHHMRAA